MHHLFVNRIELFAIHYMLVMFPLFLLFAVNLAYGFWFKGSFYAALKCLVCFHSRLKFISYLLHIWKVPCNFCIELLFFNLYFLQILYLVHLHNGAGTYFISDHHCLNGVSCSLALSFDWVHFSTYPTLSKLYVNQNPSADLFGSTNFSI